MGIGMKLMPASKQKLVSGPGSLAEVPGLRTPDDGDTQAGGEEYQRAA